MATCTITLNLSVISVISLLKFLPPDTASRLLNDKEQVLSRVFRSISAFPSKLLSLPLYTLLQLRDLPSQGLVNS